MSKTIKEFIKKSINEIEEGLPEKYRVTSKIYFELSVTTKSKGKGDVDIQIASAGTSHEINNAQKIRFSVINKEIEEKDFEAIKRYLDELKEIDEIEEEELE